jgi:hypothetical protein
MTITKRILGKCNYPVITLSSPDTVVPGPGYYCTINYKKDIRKMQLSGNHSLFPRYCGARPWLLLYHKNLQESLIEMHSFISGNFPDGVGGNSLKKINRLADDTDSDNDEKVKKGKPVRRVKLENEKMRVAWAMEVFATPRDNSDNSDDDDDLYS